MDFPLLHCCSKGMEITSTKVTKPTATVRFKFRFSSNSYKDVSSICVEKHSIKNCIYISPFVFLLLSPTFSFLFYIDTSLSEGRGNIRFFCSLDKSGSSGSSIPSNEKLDQLMTPPKTLTQGIVI